MSLDIKTLRKKEVSTFIFISCITLAAAYLLFVLINRHSVNVLFYDQWDFSISLFSKPTAWEMFNYQHGPHRQGIGAFFAYALGTITNWNMRAEAFSIGIILFIASLCALYLKYRLFGKLTPWDSLISIICLSFMQCEIAFPNTNPGYTAIPLLLVILSGIILTINNPVTKYNLLAFINFLAVFTGFGVFLGVVVPFIFGISIVFHYFNKERSGIVAAAGGLVVASLTLALFFTDYHFSPAVDCFEFPHPRPFEYAVFISHMMTLCAGFLSGYKEWLSKPLGILLFAGWMFVLIQQVWTIIRTKQLSPIHLIIFVFLSFSILYATNTAVGRVCLGTISAQSPRYLTLLIPGWLGFYFAILLCRKDSLRKLLLLALVVLFVILPIRRYKELNGIFAPMTVSRQKWVNCYLERENIQECDEIAGTKVYPNAEATHLQDKLNLLKQNHYNLFSTP